MYQWSITYWTKSGNFIMGIYEGPENDSLSVMKKIINGKENDFISHYGIDKDRMIGVRIGEIVSFEISKWNGETENG